MVQATRLLATMTSPASTARPPMGPGAVPQVAQDWAPAMGPAVFPTVQGPAEWLRPLVAAVARTPVAQTVARCPMALRPPVPWRATLLAALPTGGRQRAVHRAARVLAALRRGRPVAASLAPAPGDQQGTGSGLGAATNDGPMLGGNFGTGSGNSNAPGAAPAGGGGGPAGTPTGGMPAGAGGGGPTGDMLGGYVASGNTVAGAAGGSFNQRANSLGGNGSAGAGANGVGRFRQRTRATLHWRRE